ncbi:Antibiotic biosynthesis monooxygenase [Raoultella planticola]|uniref:Antibiotic biosynthesis monooxygenase n=1 Tax=Raoultella planticola TaxID=575 RepID=A0A485AJH1_RAOPL|nr:Antibiotic biosynthesis monooxygenase [Raoultella planticola]
MGNQQLQVIAHYYTRPDEIENVATALHALAAATRQETDNLSYAFFQSREDRRHFVILERYRHAGGLDAHPGDPAFSTPGPRSDCPVAGYKKRWRAF